MVYVLVNLLNAEVVLNHINSAIPMQPPTHTLITVPTHCILTTHIILCVTVVFHSYSHTIHCPTCSHTQTLVCVHTHMCTQTHTQNAVLIVSYWSLEHADSCTLNRHTSENDGSIIDTGSSFCQLCVCTCRTWYAWCVLSPPTFGDSMSVMYTSTLGQV